MHNLLALALLLPAAASAGGAGSSSDEVTFNLYKKFYRGDQASQRFPADSDISLELKANIDTDLWLETTGLSRLAWPENELLHSWGTNRRAGNSRLTTKLDLEAVIHVEKWGYRFNYNLWRRNYTWTKEQPIDGLMMPGSDQESVTITIRELLKDVLTYSYYNVRDYPVDLHITGDIEPTSSVTVTGSAIRSNRADFTHLDEVHAVTAPELNEGWLDMDSQWHGVVEANFNAKVWATIEGCETLTGLYLCYDKEIKAYDWILPPDVLDVRSDKEQYTLDIPAAQSDRYELELGDVEVGTSAKAQLHLQALSTAVVSGEASLDDAQGVYSLVAGTHVNVNGNSQAPIVIEFAPSEAGEFSSTLTIETNDPSEPTLKVAVHGTGVEAVVEPEPTDTGAPDEPDAEAGPNDLERGCGCASSSPMSGSLGLGLVALLGLRRRRS